MLLGTIADVVPLEKENRYWVRKGICQINREMSYSFSRLTANTRNPEKKGWNSTDIGYSLAPQLNALGRLDDPRDAVKFLICSDQSLIDRIGHTLKEINEKRREVEGEIYEQIKAKIDSGHIDISSEHVIFDSSNNWPPGVIGLVAGRLMHNFARPVFLFHLSKDGLAKGSCRSIPGFNVFTALDQEKDMLKSYGGHQMAAGLSLEIKDLPELKKRLNQAVAAKYSIDQLQPKLNVDVALELNEINPKLMNDLEKLEPFGNSNPVPVFLIKDLVLLKKPTLMKKLHLKCTVFAGGMIKQILFFNRPELYKKIINNGETPFSIVGQIMKNEWNGSTSLEISGLDINFKN
jgi:single-stranded-DNA-specific exonuclease